MSDENKSKEQLLAELSELRQSVAEMKLLEEKRRLAEDELQKSEEKYQSLVDSTDDSIYLVDNNCNYLYMNKKHLTRLGLNTGQFIGRSYNEFHTQEEVQEFIVKVSRTFRTGESSQYEYKSERDNRFFLQTFSPVKDNKGVVIAATVVSKDITERKKTEEILLQSKQDWENTFNTITDMITVHDKDYNIIRANKAAEKLLGLPFLVGENKCFKYYHGADNPLPGCPSCSCLHSGEAANFEIHEPHLNMYLEIRAIPRFDSNNKLVGLIHVVRDITERKKMEDRLQEMSITDELTGLLNRRGFFSLAEKQLLTAERKGRDMAVIYADMDDLKGVNDTWGHKEGDIALMEIANMLRQTFRESDIISRLGGDEFAVLVEITESNDELFIKKRLEENLNIINMQENRRYKLNISVGMVRCDLSHPCSIDELLSKSDKLMYANKKSKS